MEREPGPGGKRWSVYRPSRKKVSEGGGPATATTPPASKPAAKPDSPPQWAPGGIDRPRSPKVGIIAGIGLVVLVLGMSGLFAYLGSDRDEGDGFFGGKSEVPVLTPDGVADLVRAIEDETGSTEVFSATVYPTYAVVKLPVDATSQREEGFYWDGHDLEPWAGKGTSSHQRIDLADLDTATVPAMVEAAKEQVDEPTSWYLSIDHGSTEDVPTISAYASNEYNEGGFVEFGYDGSEVSRTTW